MFAEIKTGIEIPDADEIVIGIVHKGQTRKFELVCQPVRTPFVHGQEADDFIGICGGYYIAMQRVDRQRFVSQLVKMRQASPEWHIFVVATGNVVDEKTSVVLCAMPPGTTPHIRIPGGF